MQEMGQYLQEWWNLYHSRNLDYLVAKLGGISHYAPGATVQHSGEAIEYYNTTPKINPTTSISQVNDKSEACPVAEVPIHISGYRVSWAPELHKTFEYFRPDSTYSSVSQSPLSLSPIYQHPPRFFLSGSSSLEISTESFPLEEVPGPSLEITVPTTRAANSSTSTKSSSMSSSALSLNNLCLSSSSPFIQANSIYLEKSDL